jgi:hypothetical protein
MTERISNLLYNNLLIYSVALVRMRTMATERPPLVALVIINSFAIIYNHLLTYSVVLVRMRTMPTERPPLVALVIINSICNHI